MKLITDMDNKKKLTDAEKDFIHQEKMDKIFMRKRAKDIKNGTLKRVKIIIDKI